MGMGFNVSLERENELENKTFKNMVGIYLQIVFYI